MRAKCIIIGVVVVVLLSSAAMVAAGNLDSPSGPMDDASQMYTLEQIYDHLDTGAAMTKMTTFTEPASGPAPIGRTLDEVMSLAKPGALAPRVNKTGETDCHYGDGGGICTCGDENCPPGQDGYYQMGIDPAMVYPPAYDTPEWAGVRFTDNGDGTITDNLTALIWLKNANCWGNLKWANALTNCNALADGQCGLTDGSSAGDWRLPNINELHSLIDLRQDNPALPSGHHFDNVQSYVHWSSTSSIFSGSQAYCMGIQYGGVSGCSKLLAAEVIPVRGGQ
jgi:hypothetical protein